MTNMDFVHINDQTLFEQILSLAQDYLKIQGFEELNISLFLLQFSLPLV